ncbi:MAG: hypothetical protein H0V26_08195, partial [Solirubrobacterales bacterium]|nr:hypothetical protein [Solirubrobacterales bacterium]
MLSNALRRRTLSALAAVGLLVLIPLGVADAKPPHSKSTSSYGDTSQALLRGALSGSLVTDAELFGVKPGTSP